MRGDTMPVYYVIFKVLYTPNGVPIYQIIKVYACDLADVDNIWRNEGYANPLVNYQAHIYYREPANPFRKSVTENTDEVKAIMWGVPG